MMELTTPIYRRCEVVLHSDKTYENPFLDVNVNAVFTHTDGTSIALPGFWNGNNEWKVRFIAQKAGAWRYSITCTDETNASLTDVGVITATAAEPRNDLEKHGYVVIPEGKRYFAHEDGTPFFWLGDTHWQMPDYERLHECNYPGCTCGNQFKHLVDDRVKKGFTVYQTYFDSAESDGGGNKRVHHWWQEKYTLINPQAFNETMDEMIEYLAEQGITTAMGFGVHINTIAAMNSDPAPILAFARYCVARYACYPVVWITAQEITDLRYNTFDIWQQVGKLVGELDGYHHPNGAHMYPMEAQDERAQALYRDDWHNTWILQAGHGGVSRLKPRSFYKSYYQLEKVKPYVEGECHYEDIYCGAFCGCDASRIGAWQAIQSGAAGFTYGVTGVWAMEWNETDDRGWLSYSPEPWYIGMDKPGSTEMTYLRKFYEYVGWKDLEPSFDHTFGSFEMRKYVSISHRGQDVLIYYFFSPLEEDGILFGLKPGVKYQMRWYDPIHGGFIDLPDVVSEDGTLDVPQRPSRRDWVLLLNCVYLGQYETFAYPAYIRNIAAKDAALGEKYDIVSLRTTSEDPEHPSANLTDGNEETYWQGLAPKTSQTIIADLGEDKKLGYFKMGCREKEYRMIRYRVYGSHDGETWDLISERPNDVVAIGGQYPIFYDPMPGTYRFVKIFIASNMQDTQLKLNEFAIFAKAE